MRKSQKNQTTTNHTTTPPAVVHVAVLTLAEIKAATEAFDRGETNAWDAIAAIRAAVEACSAAAPRRKAA